MSYKLKYERKYTPIDINKPVKRYNMILNSVLDAYQVSISKAKQTGQNVSIIFNDIVLVVTPIMSFKTFNMIYESQIKNKSEDEIVVKKYTKIYKKAF